jgi:drug/metabolite transporter (DMT)-like permease
MEKVQITPGLIGLCFAYTIAASNEYWSMNWMKSNFGIKLAVFFALLQNASWPAQIYFYFSERSHLPSGETRIITKAMYKSYFILGALAAFITLSRTMGIASLPPTTYAIVANTEIVFESFMTIFILKRPISKLQAAAVCCVLSGVMVSLIDPATGKFGDVGGVSHDELVSGIILSLASRFSSSLNTVLADRYLSEPVR